MKIILLLSVLASCLALGGAARGQNYAINWFTIGGGGGTSTGGGFSVSGTSGQADAGSMSGGGGYSLVGGFWGGISVLQTLGAPLLSITNAGHAAVVSWPRPADGFMLERTPALAAPPVAILWNVVPPSEYVTNATRILFPVMLSGERQFFRLRRQ